MSYDVITVGGGLAGSALAQAMAKCGHRVLVLERETEFRDRVRGEQMHPWGVSAARVLGIYDSLAESCGNQTRYWTTWVAGKPAFVRDLAETTPHGCGSFNLPHPAMQETLFRLAGDAGAEMRRGVRVDEVFPGDPPVVRFRENGSEETLEARVVVGADGRNSKVRKWGGFEVQRDPDRLMIAGLLFEDFSAPEDATHLCVGAGYASLVAPLAGGRARVYFMYPKETGRRLSGDAQVEEFLDCCRQAAVPEEWLEGARPAGPLAQFNGADHWVEHPARGGMVLMGDAAASSDPAWGSGLSLTLLDALCLSECLDSTDDWNAAIHKYAEEHDRHYGALHQVTQMWADLIWTPGEAAEERRQRVLPSLLTEPEGMPDVIGLGPESPLNEEARARLGEEPPYGDRREGREI